MRCRTAVAFWLRGQLFCRILPAWETVRLAAGEPLLEQAEQRLWRLVRERESLRSKLLADLQGGELSRIFCQIGIHHGASPVFSASILLLL